MRKAMMQEPVDPVQRAFLGVETSVLGQRWVARLDQAGENRALAMAQTFGIPDLVCRVLAGRGVEVEKAKDFLDPTIRSLMPDPFSLTDLDKGAARLSKPFGDRKNWQSLATMMSTAPHQRR
jgi:single-stranded-DNA-specific exonuclease